MDYKTKVFQNKNNKQLFIALNKRKLELLKGRIPKNVTIKDMEFEF